MFDLPPVQFQPESVIQTMVVVKATPTKADHERYAKEISDACYGKFKWSDLFFMMRSSVAYLNADFPGLEPKQLRESCTQILNHVIDITDTPFLPDNWSDPLFKRLVPTFVAILVPDDNSVFVPATAKSALTPEKIEAHLTQIAGAFKDGFQWSDITTVTIHSIQFVNGFMNVDLSDKQTVAKGIVDTIIDNTDTPYLPDLFFDPIFKAIAHPLIDFIVEKTFNQTTSAA